MNKQICYQIGWIHLAINQLPQDYIVINIFWSNEVGGFVTKWAELDMQYGTELLL